MANKNYLIFSLNGLLYGVEALLVQEIFYLPELTPIADAPNDIIGLLNLRGQILPVMHFALRLGQQIAECSLSDSVIVFAWEGLQIGIIVSAVHEVRNIDLQLIESKICYGRVGGTSSRFITGVAKVDTDMIMLLDPEHLIRHSQAVASSSPHEASDDLTEKVQEHLGITHSFYDRCCPQATPEVKAVFRERADNLRQLSESSDFTGLMPVAVIGLNGEYFGLDLEVVREFTSLSHVTPIPCCPPHIVGNMNLRGKIITLVDIRGALKMPLTASNTSKAIVIQFDQVVAGLPVDEVFDVMYLRPSEVRHVPAALNSDSNEFLRGTAPYSEKMLTILDLPKVLTKGDLAVNEEV